MESRVVFHSMTLRLFLLLAGTIVVAFGAYALVGIRTVSEGWEASVYEGAERISDLIRRSTHYGMLLNRKEDVHQVIRDVAEAHGVEGVRIYDKAGAIIYSADESEIGNTVDVQAEACVGCHATGGSFATGAGTGVRVFERPDGRRVLGLIDPIENAPECSTAACHAHPPGRNVLGVLDVRMSMEDSDTRLAAIERQSAVAAVLIALFAGLLAAVFLLREVRGPVRALTSAAERVAGGDLETEIQVTRTNELGQLARTFNEMTRELRVAKQDLTDWSDKLEVRLRERTEELGRSQRQVAHMDKMASLGTLAASVAHELNNPLAGILNYAKLVERSVREEELVDREELCRFLGLIQKEALRTGSIVRNLLAFARPSGTSFRSTSLNPLLERAVMLVRHRLEMADVRCRLAPLEGPDELECDGDQVVQGLVALLINAVEAMPEGGELEVRAEDDGDEVRIVVSDTGVGIPEGSLEHIFEPFFTSKSESDGAGLGLAVLYGIVQRHGGRIDVHSEPGRGTTFLWTLPRGPRSEGARETLETVEGAV